MEKRPCLPFDRIPGCPAGRSGYSDKIFSNLTLFFTIVMVLILAALVFILTKDAMPGD